jgi:hypothetical protein
MPFDSNGTFNRVIAGGWQADAAAGTKIRADRHDAEDDGFATGLSMCITKDGRTQPLANIPMNGKKLIALGEPTNPNDAATKNYVDTFKSFTTGANISGAGPINGFLTFTSPTGVNGVGWVTADMSWVGKLEEAVKTQKRLVVNDKADGTGADVCIVGETGIINNSGYLTNNLSHDGTDWRTIGTGTGTMLHYANGQFDIWSNDTATIAPYQLASMRQFFNVQNTDGSVDLTLTKSASAKHARIWGKLASKNRWLLELGDGAAETATERVGSNFNLYSYDNAGSALVNEMTINRETHKTTFTGAVTSGGIVTAVSQFLSSTTICVLGGTSGGTIYLRPQGYAVPGVSISPAGSIYVAEGATTSGAGVYGGCGYIGKQGYTGNYDNNWHNLFYQSGFEYVFVNSTLMGAITWQSDYRIKKNIRPLPSMWDRVKGLKPIKYEHRKYKEFIEADGIERWGLLAHELQETLLPSACIGNKDEDNVIQSVNPLVMITVLTKALQEAMARIEALEAAA